MKFGLAVLLWLVAVSPSLAQTYTIGVFSSSATDAAMGSPVAQVTYQDSAVLCNQGRTAQPSSVVGVPVVAWWDDPSVSGRACYLNVAQQMRSLQPGDYKAAVSRATSGWSLLSLRFTVPVPPAPPTVPPPAPKTCIDGTAVYQVGSGPPVERRSFSSTTSTWEAWSSRVRQLEAAGFRTNVELNSTYAYIQATCW